VAKKADRFASAPPCGHLGAALIDLRDFGTAREAKEKRRTPRFAGPDPTAGAPEVPLTCNPRSVGNVLNH